MTTLQRILLVLLAATLCCTPAWADEGEADKRFHDAYVLEVIDGKVADAAKVYLALMDDEQVAKRLRAEARFRFAICTVLLGRADEARVHLARLVEDRDTPMVVRTRAEAYGRTIADIKVGTELDKRLPQLLFDLGRAHPDGPVPAYRDFAIIGRPAVPFLKKLLSHTDRNLRKHAFRLLCRLKEPGMASVWSPDIHSTSASFVGELLWYLNQSPAELKAFEERVLGLGEQAMTYASYLKPAPKFSLDFITAIARSGVAPHSALTLLGELDDERYDLLLRWMEGEDEELAFLAFDRLLEDTAALGRIRPTDYPRVLAQLTGHLAEDEDDRISSGSLSGFLECTERLPAVVVLDTLEVIVRDVEENGGLLWTRKAAYELFPHVTEAFDAREVRPAATEHARYAGLLRRWLTCCLASLQSPDRRDDSKWWHDTEPYARHLRVALTAMEEAPALVHVRELIAARAWDDYADWLEILPQAHDGRSVRAVMAAIAVASTDRRDDLIERLTYDGPRPVPQDYLDEMDAAYVKLLTILDGEEIGETFTEFRSYCRMLPPERAEEQLARILEKARGLSASKRETVLWSVLPSDAWYFENVLAPLAKNRWSWLDKDERKALLEEAFEKISRGVQWKDSTQQTKRAALALIREHITEVDPPVYLFRLIDYRKSFPLELWLPHAPAGAPAWQLAELMSLTEEDANLVAGYVAERLERVNAPVLEFVKARADEEIRRQIFDDLLTSDVAEQRVLALDHMMPSGYPASTAAIEASIAIELEADPRDLWRLRRIGQVLLVRRPSEKLFPVARALLRSDDRRLIAEGVKMADSLGREDLVPDLALHLRSMDANIRTLASKALAAIRAIAEIQAQVPAKGGRK